MLFNSIGFMIFFPTVCILYYLIPKRWSHVFLLAASYYFYMCWNPKYALLMLASTGITWASGLLIARSQSQKEKKLYVALSFVLNLAILAFFKYFGFAVDSINHVLSALHMSPLAQPFDVVLPVGISFYTFQALSYTMDVYRDEIYPEKNFLRYALFVSFFPQLVAGPIERSKNLLKQLAHKNRFAYENLQIGFTRMLFGFFQKVVIADTAAVFVTQVYDHYTEYGTVELTIATLLFAVQIYCDFGGYSNIAIGAARMMGYHLMENFDTPYFSQSVSEFWRRWHISLSSWFRDYLYIPLGGNRKGRVRKYINLMIVFLTSGLWHGASWHFVAWGGLNGLYQVAGDILRPAREKLMDLCGVDREAFSHRLGRRLITFGLVSLSWVFFRASSVRDSLRILKRMATRWNPWVLCSGQLFELGLNEAQFRMLLTAILVLFAADLVQFFKGKWMETLRTQGVWLRYAVYLALIFSVLIFGYYGSGYDASQFIYFQF